jgi:hypothetical protein
MRLLSFFSYATILLLALAAVIVMAGGPASVWGRITGDVPAEEAAQPTTTGIPRGFGGDAGVQADRAIRDIEAMDELSRSVGR